MLSRFHSNPGTSRTVERTDRLTDGQICYINIGRQSADARRQCADARLKWYKAILSGRVIRGNKNKSQVLLSMSSFHLE